jgi:hypothetical protein
MPVVRPNWAKGDSTPWGELEIMQLQRRFSLEAKTP